MVRESAKHLLCKKKLSQCYSTVIRCIQLVHKPAASASCMRLLLSSFSGTFLHPTHRHSEEQAIFAYNKVNNIQSITYTTDL